MSSSQQKTDDLPADPRSAERSRVSEIERLRPSELFGVVVRGFGIYAMLNGLYSLAWGIFFELRIVEPLIPDVRIRHSLAAS